MLFTCVLHSVSSAIVMIAKVFKKKKRNDKKCSKYCSTMAIKLVLSPVEHSVKLTESYEDIKYVLNFLQYGQHNWKICIDMEIISVILGLQVDYTKYP